MQGSEIGANSSLNYVITDKDVTIKDSRTLTGYETYPVFISKGSSV
jgi:glucose-1-phosphate adenylyltransferase